MKIDICYTTQAWLLVLVTEDCFCLSIKEFFLRNRSCPWSTLDYWCQVNCLSSSSSHYHSATVSRLTLSARFASTLSTDFQI